MKRTQFLAILALVCALGLATPAVMGAFAEGETTAVVANENQPTTVSGVAESEQTAEVANAEQLLAALEAEKGMITLTEDITVTNNVKVDYDVVLDLGGKTLSSGAANARVLDITKGKVRVTNGTVKATGKGGCAMRVVGSNSSSDTDYVDVTVDSNVTLWAEYTYGENEDSASYGLFVSEMNKGQQYGVKVLFSGTIVANNGMSVNGNIKTQTNYPVITINDGATITANDDGIGIYAAGYASWNIGAATITGGTGIGIKSGMLATNNTTIETQLKGTPVEGNNNGINGAGAVFQIEDNGNYAKGVNIRVNGGAYTSKNGDVFYEYAATEGKSRAVGETPKIEIIDGTFTAGENYSIFEGVDTKNAVTFKGGTYDPKAKDFSELVKVLEEQGLQVSESGEATKPSPSNPGGSKDDDDEKDDEKKDPAATTPGKKPSSPDTGAELFGALGGNSSIITAALVGILLVAGCWAFYAMHRSRVARAAAARKAAARRSTAKRSTASRKTSATKAKSAARSTKSAKTTKKTTTRRK